MRIGSRASGLAVESVGTQTAGPDLLRDGGGEGFQHMLAVNAVTGAHRGT